MYLNNQHKILQELDIRSHLNNLLPVLWNNIGKIPNQSPDFSYVFQLFVELQSPFTL